jgi:DNA repair photolyase
MKPIYEPGNKAREYSPMALNIYINGCPHKCRYCFSPRVTFNSNYFSSTPEPRTNLILLLEKQLKKETINAQVLLSFIGDPYNSEEKKHRITRQVLEILLANKVPVAILTKDGKNCLDDIDLFKRFDGHIKVGASLTFIENKDSLEWEPGASLPNERFDALKELHRNGIKTWASLEPVIDPEQTVRIIEETHEYVDHYKVGKINHMKEIEARVDWLKFLEEVVIFLRRIQKPYYIKHSLQIHNRSIQFRPEEIDQDHLCVPSF